MTNKLVEQVAEHICTFNRHVKSWDGLDEFQKESWRYEARKLIPLIREEWEAERLDRPLAPVLRDEEITNHELPDSDFDITGLLQAQRDSDHKHYALYPSEAEIKKKVAEEIKRELARYIWGRAKAGIESLPNAEQGFWKGYWQGQMDIPLSAAWQDFWNKYLGTNSGQDKEGR